MSEAHGARAHIISVFGSSRAADDSEIYRQAYELGQRLAAASYVVCNGGYDGAMRAVSQGAREAGGHVIGVTLELFRGRTPNPWLAERIHTETIFSRLEELITRADGYVVINGGSGTLTELCLVWGLLLTRVLEPRPLILLGEQWRPVLDSFVANLDVHPEDLSVLQIAPTPADVVALLQRALGK